MVEQEVEVKEVLDDGEPGETKTERKGQDRREKTERRAGMDRRCVVAKEFQGEERRVTEDERRNDMERRRGPGRRRCDERRSAEEGEMTDDQFAFIKAIEEYKRINKRPFPSYTEILEIAIAIGYRKVAEQSTI